MSDRPQIRLYLDVPLRRAAVIECDRAQANYLLNVMRLKDGQQIAVFNGREGEWLAALNRDGRKAATLALLDQIRPQAAGPDLHYIFAPLKRARLDYMVQKAVELGVSRLTPVITAYTQAERINLERMQANAIEAAEQCGILSLPDIDSPVKLVDLINEWDKSRALIFCDESKGLASPVEDLQQLQGRAVSVLIGPEGGFSAEEGLLLGSQEFVTSLSLGPRIMRADTAAVAALTLVNAVLGDWRAGC